MFVFQANDRGEFFPIWGTCMGMQLLTVLVAEVNLLVNTPAENIAMPLNLTTGYSYCVTFSVNHIFHFFNTHFWIKVGLFGPKMKILNNKKIVLVFKSHDK